MMARVRYVSIFDQDVHKTFPLYISASYEVTFLNHRVDQAGPPKYSTLWLLWTPINFLFKENLTLDTYVIKILCYLKLFYMQNKVSFFSLHILLVKRWVGGQMLMWAKQRYFWQFLLLRKKNQVGGFRKKNHTYSSGNGDMLTFADNDKNMLT